MDHRFPSGSDANAAEPTLLSISNLVTGYGGNEVIRNLDLEVGPGEMVALIGPNGAGKTTTARAIVGLVPAWDGAITYRGQPTNNESTRSLLARGLRLVPQEGGVFANLSIGMNLEIGAQFISGSSRDDVIRDVLVLFPALIGREKQPAAALSGGQQQMLSVAMALVAQPKMLILDEPSQGLAPNLFEAILSAVDSARHTSGLGVLMIEQNVRKTLEIADRVIVLRNGSVVHQQEAVGLELSKLWEFF